MLNTALRRSKFPSYVSSQTKLPQNPFQNIAPIHYDRLDSWKPNQPQYSSVGQFTIASFNMLAPVYKRLSSLDLNTGARKRESQIYELWQSRALKTKRFFEEELFPNADIIALQEFWLQNIRYLNVFREEFYKHGYQIFMLQRTGTKLDAVVLLVKHKTFQIKKVENVYLCNMRDRVALMVWMQHKETGKDLIVVNTHLSFPHNNLESISQVQQMEMITKVMDNFAHRYEISHATRLVVGDFNAEMKSRVCEHLRKIGFSSCFEICPPFNPQFDLITNNVPLTKSAPSQPITAQGSASSLYSHSLQNQHYGLTTFVSHRNHLKEDVGVDHIFIKPETDKEASKLVTLVDWTMSATIDDDGTDHHNFSDETPSMNSTSFHLSSQHRHHHLPQSESVQSHKQSSSSNLTLFATSENKQHSISDANTNDAESSIISDQKIFVDECHVLPKNKTHQLWDDDFRISDHRPVIATIIFGKKKATTSA